ncbi:ABC transporter permease [Lactobacillus sp. ESL0791]|uniref:ABC transporter permease n=1 Tax=Lactobacillus sp. ESL0791 TaxID=2983234 RepID=UPI0023F90D1D|nr:ABC transporter permease [Lactobacillus sp. ESL0791]MDF7638932.1 ABC transporter permease [Lactobacillus sp. ESL0791]
MIFSIKQEFYKLTHKKSTWIAPLFLLALMLMAAFAFGIAEGKLLMMTCFDAPDWIMFILVVVGSTTFSMEFQNNAILTLLYKANSKIKVYLAKFVVIFAYDLLLHFLAIMFTLILKPILLGSRYSWTIIYQYQQPLWENMLKTMLVDLMTTMLLISLVFLLSCLSRSNAIVITVSLLVIFMGQSISDELLTFTKFANVKLMRWNPFNMFNLTRQYYNFITYHATTKLLNPELIMGTMAYLLIFFILGYTVFRKRKF